MEKQEIRVYVDRGKIFVDLEGISEIGAIRMLQAGINLIVEGKTHESAEEVTNGEETNAL